MVAQLMTSPDENGFVADAGRVNYVRAHLMAVYEAIQANLTLGVRSLISTLNYVCCIADYSRWMLV